MGQESILRMFRTSFLCLCVYILLNTESVNALGFVYQPYSLNCSQGRELIVRDLRFDLDDPSSSAMTTVLTINLQCSHCNLQLNPTRVVGPLYFKKGDIFGAAEIEVRGNLQTLQYALTEVLYVPFEEFIGVDTIVLTMSDEEGHTSIGTSAVSVYESIAPPSLNVGSGKVLGHVGSVLSLGANVTSLTGHDFTLLIAWSESGMGRVEMDESATCGPSSCVGIGSTLSDLQTLLSSAQYIATDGVMEVVDDVNITILVYNEDGNEITSGSAVVEVRLYVLILSTWTLSVDGHSLIS